MYCTWLLFCLFVAVHSLVFATPLIQDPPIQDVSKAHRRQPKRLYEKKGKKGHPGYDRGPKETTVYVHYTLTATKTITIGNDDSRGRDDSGRGREGGPRFDFGQLFEYERLLAAPTPIPVSRPSVADAKV
ncbi:hypothetical protein G6F43_003656 [Rhizopus delemar]|nr:hypothetical protein G6F43_003656 [Rhizopus delemar]